MVCKLHLRRKLKLHFSACDIQCQYCLDFVKRMSDLDDLNAETVLESVQVKDFLNMLKTHPPTRAAVGKFHAPAYHISTLSSE